MVRDSGMWFGACQRCGLRFGFGHDERRAADRAVRAGWSVGAETTGSPGDMCLSCLEATGRRWRKGAGL